MTQDLVERAEQLPSVESAAQPRSMLAIIAQAASDPAVDVAKMQALLDMHTQIEARQAEREYNIALNAAQAEIEPVARTAENTQTRSFYAKLEHINDAIRPIYIKHGFSLSYDTVAPLSLGNIRIECLCSHAGGHTKRYGREAPADTLGPKGAPVKTALHGSASTETFLKRYITCGIFNIVFRDQDDDGVLGGMEFIDADKVRQIETLLAETKADLPRFLAFAKAKHVSEIMASEFPRCIAQLERKKREQEAERGR